MSDALPQLANDGPLVWMAQGIQARLALAFPPKQFMSGWMPSKPTRKWFDATAKRTPFIALAWNGTRPNTGTRVFEGTAHWTVLLVTKNDRVEDRYLGNSLNPGLFAMVRAATWALQGYVIDPSGTPWTATGMINVAELENLYSEDWAPEDAAIAGLTLTIDYDESLPTGMDDGESDAVAELATQWSFAGSPPPFQTDTLSLETT